MVFNQHLLFVVASVLFLCSSCKDSSPEGKEIQQLHEEVMVIHDDVMPKMRDIYKLRKALLKHDDQSEVEHLISALENADDAMMDWMADYKKPKASDPGYQQYLANEKVLIAGVRDQMLSAISDAEAFLNQ